MRKIWRKNFESISENILESKKKQTLITNVNITKIDLKKKYFYITYFNCNKKGYYSKSCFKPLKNKY